MLCSSEPSDSQQNFYKSPLKPHTDLDPLCRLEPTDCIALGFSF